MLSFPVIAGIISGIVFPTGFFISATKIEGGLQKRATARGRNMYWTLTPQKKKRNFDTGEIEPTNEEVDFDPRHGHYMKCGEIIITLASASLIFIPSLHFTSTLPWLGLPMVLLGFTVVYALSFMGLLTFFYEMQLNDPNSFTMFRSNLVFALGFGGLSCFAIAYFVLSILIGTALSHGALVNIGR